MFDKDSIRIGLLDLGVNNVYKLLVFVFFNDRMKSVISVLDIIDYSDYGIGMVGFMFYGDLMDIIY